MSTETLKAVITGDASGIDKASAQAAAALKKVSQSAAEWDKKARELNLQTNYTSRAFTGLSASAAKAATPVAQSGKAMSTLAAGTGRANFALISLGQGISDIPFGFTAIANNIQQTVQAFTLVERESGGVKGALKGIFTALKGPTGIFLAFSVVTAAIEIFTRKSAKAKEQTDELAKAIADMRKGLKDVSDIQGGTISATAKQTAELNALYNAATDAARGDEERYAAAKDLQTIFPKTFGSISQLKIVTGQAADAFNSLSNNIREVATANVILSEMEKNIKTIGDATDKLNDVIDPEKLKLLTGNVVSAQNAFNRALKSGNYGSISIAERSLNKAKKALEEYTATVNGYQSVIIDATVKNKQLEASFDALNFKIQKTGDSTGTTADKISKLSKNISALPAIGGQVGAIPIGITTPGVPTTITGAPTGGGISDPDKLAREKANEFSPLLESLNQIGVLSDSVFSQMNDKLKGNAGAAGLLANSFESIFSTIAQGGNPFQAMVQGIEQLIIKLIAVTAAIEVINLIPGGPAVLKVLDVASSVPRFAGGGFIPGPQLAVVGDAPGGEWVLNQRQVSAILQGAGSGKNIQITGELKLRGNELRAALKRANDANNTVN